MLNNYLILEPWKLMTLCHSEVYFSFIIIHILIYMLNNFKTIKSKNSLITLKLIFASETKILSENFATKLV